MRSPEYYLAEAIELARDNVRQGGRPFGAVLVRDGEVAATGVNGVVATNDPTAHAEMAAVRAASGRLGTADLRGSVVYASGQPCPMCLAAMYVSGVREVFYAYSNDDGEPFGLSSSDTYAELIRPEGPRTLRMTYRPVRPANQPDPYELWSERTGARKGRQGE